jgi:hypothetical protein
MSRITRVLLVGLLLVPPGRSQAQELLQFFACGTIRFFAEACAPTAEPSPAAIPAVATPEMSPAPPPPSPLITNPAPPASGFPPQDTPLPPLFPPETVSPDMPPLLLQLLENPTEAHARAFLAWHRARLQRLQVVQALLRALQAAEGEPQRPVPGPVPGPQSTHMRP